jgi:hypothetical protein
LHKSFPVSLAARRHFALRNFQEPAARRFHFLWAIDAYLGEAIEEDGEDNKKFLHLM